MPELLVDHAALARIDADAVVALTRAATDSTFHSDGLRPDQLARNARVVAMSGPTALAAAGNAHQHLVAAFVDGRFAGFVIATLHGPDDRELDWLMVHPDFHGSEVSTALMRAGMAWLGTGRAMWLNVLQHNERAIRFYRRFGFEISRPSPAPDADSIPQYIMVRPADAVEAERT